MHLQNFIHQIYKTIVLTSLPLTFVAVMPTAAQAANFSSIYAFGDSLTDTGNSFAIIPGLPPSQVGYFNGRFSNGPIWLDQLASKLGLPLPPVSQLAGGNSPTGINFAVNSATTGDQNTFPIPGLPGYVGLTQQITQFIQANPVADSQALYILWAGANDYVGAGVTNPNQPVANLVGAVDTLYNFGARNFLVVNLPLLGSTPIATSQGQVVSEGLNQLSLGHNFLFSQAFGQSNPNQPGIKLKTLDAGSLFQQAIITPSKFNLTNVKDPCLENSPLFANPFSPPPEICDNPDEYLFWDSLHPTSAAHRFIGNLAYKTLVPEPSMILSQLAVGAVLGSIAVRKGKRRKNQASVKKHPSTELSG
ncbi:SGNH/GDSL hydrolase family protein [Anabaena minutissima FACHB-250]|nr:SGNH/GDSL hydrolase family protein [Anabaena minutissima FACHB-250]